MKVKFDNIRIGDVILIGKELHLVIKSGETWIHSHKYIDCLNMRWLYINYGTHETRLYKNENPTLNLVLKFNNGK